MNTESDLTNFLRYLKHTCGYSIKGLLFGALLGLVAYFAIPACYQASLIVAEKDPLHVVETEKNATYGELQGRSVGAEVAGFEYLLSSPEVIAKHLGKDATPESIRNLQKKIKSRVLYPDPFVKISLGSKTPEDAKETLAVLIRLANETLKQKVLEQSAARIAYLQKRLQDVYDPAQKIALAEILRAEEMKSMAAEADSLVTVKIIDALYADNRRDFPQFHIIFPLFIFLGLMGGLLLYHVRQAAK